MVKKRATALPDSPTLLQLRDAFGSRLDKPHRGNCLLSNGSRGFESLQGRYKAEANLKAIKLHGPTAMESEELLPILWIFVGLIRRKGALVLI